MRELKDIREQTACRLSAERSWSGWFEEKGFREYEFYYPYPDYKFPTAVYSDRYLPKKGELLNNIRNFDADRYVLFDEGKAFDSLADTGYFPIFSNSFFVRVRRKG